LDSPNNALADHKYVLLTTLKRDGTAVPTPVGPVHYLDGVAVITRAQGKVKRIRNNPSVTVAPCTFRGRLLSEPTKAHAEILADDHIDAVLDLVAAKYRLSGGMLKRRRKKGADTFSAIRITT